MDPLEQFLAALLAAIVQALAPVLISEAQKPSTASDGFVDPQLQQQILSAINKPS